MIVLERNAEEAQRKARSPAWCPARWKLPCLPLLWIPRCGTHSSLEFLRNSTGTWKSLRDSHSSHRAYYWIVLGRPFSRRNSAWTFWESNRGD